MCCSGASGRYCRGEVDTLSAIFRKSECIQHLLSALWRRLFLESHRLTVFYLAEALVGLALLPSPAGCVFVGSKI